MTLFVVGQSEARQIKTEREYEFNIRIGQTDSVGILKALRHYEKDGNLTLEINYCEYSWDCAEHPDSFKTKYEYFYNHKGQLIERNYYNEGHSLPWSMTTYSYKIDHQGLIAEKTIETTHSFDRHKTFSTDKEVEIFEYDKNGNLQKEISRHIDPDFTFEFVTTYKYDNKGNLVKVDFSNNFRKAIKKYSYDQQGNRIKYEFEGRQSCGHNIDHWERKYDQKGNLIEQTTCTAVNKCSRKQFVYNDSNLRVKETDQSIDGTYSTNQEFYYNDNEDLIEIKVYDRKGQLDEIVKYVYEYY